MSNVINLKPQIPVLQALKEGDRKQVLKIQIDIEGHLLNIKTHFFEIGKLLSRAKEILPHGTYQRWIEETFGDQLPYPTAACFKAIYERFKDQPQSVMLLPVTLLQQMAQPSFPDEIIKLINDNAEAFKNADFEEIKEAHGKFKSGEIDLSQFETLAAKQIKIGMEILEGRAHARNSRTAKQTTRIGINEIRRAIGKVRKYTGKLRCFFPSAEGERPSATECEMLNHNDKVDAVMQEILDDDLLKEIDLCIGELEKLKTDIEDRRGLFRQRLVEENGVIKKKEISNL